MLRKLLPAMLLVASAPCATAQLITEPARATAARDSLLQMAAATRLELIQQTGFAVKAPRMGARRHVVQGFIPLVTPSNLPESGRKKILIWEQKTIYRRNGRVTENYVAMLNGRKILQERRLNGEVLWLNLSRPLALSNVTATTRSAYYGTYIRGGFINWNAKKYMLPKAY